MPLDERSLERYANKFPRATKHVYLFPLLLTNVFNEQSCMLFYGKSNSFQTRMPLINLVIIWSLTSNNLNLLENIFMSFHSENSFEENSIENQKFSYNVFFLYLRVFHCF